MARISIAAGSCPVCGRAVARTLTTHHGLAVESYHCPEHGRRTSNPDGALVSEWAAPSMVELRSLLEVPASAGYGIGWVH
jgi:hypothetical protein